MRMEGKMDMKQVLKKISNLTLPLIFVLVTMISILPPDVDMAADLDVS